MSMALFLRQMPIVLQRDPLPSTTRCRTKSVKQGGKGKRNTDLKRREPPPPPGGDGSKRSQSSKKNLYDLLAICPDWGQGMKFQKKTWRDDRYYIIKRINLCPSLNHGKAWGTFCENGAVKTGLVRRIGGTNKRNWKTVERPAPEKLAWKRLADLEPERWARHRKAKVKRNLRRKEAIRRHAAERYAAAATGASTTEQPEVPA